MTTSMCCAKLKVADKFELSGQDYESSARERYNERAGQTISQPQDILPHRSILLSLAEKVVENLKP